MFFNPLKRPFAIVFAYLFIAGSISVTLSAAIPGSEVSSDGLLSARAPPKKIATVSFPEVDIEDAYPLILNPTDLVELQELFLEKIATDMKDLLKKPELSTITAENLDVAEGSQLRLYRKPSDLQRYIMPYSVKAGDKEYTGMTLQMWNVDDKGKTVTPKARLFRKPYIKQNKDVSKPEKLLEIASRSKFVITFTTDTNEAFKHPSTRLSLREQFQGLLDMCPNVTDVIVKDIKQALKLEELLRSDIKFDKFPSVLEFNDCYAVPYKLEHSMSKYSGGQLEVLKDKTAHWRGRVRRFGGSGQPSSIEISKEVEKVLPPIIDMNANAKMTIVSIINNVQSAMPTIWGKYWRQDRNIQMFFDPLYHQDESPHYNMIWAMLRTAQHFGGQTTALSGRDVEKYYHQQLKESSDKRNLRKLA